VNLWLYKDRGKLAAQGCVTYSNRSGGCVVFARACIVISHTRVIRHSNPCLAPYCKVLPHNEVDLMILDPLSVSVYSQSFMTPFFHNVAMATNIVTNQQGVDRQNITWLGRGAR